MIADSPRGKQNRKSGAAQHLADKSNKEIFAINQKVFQQLTDQTKSLQKKYREIDRQTKGSDKNIFSEQAYYEIRQKVRDQEDMIKDLRGDESGDVGGKQRELEELRQRVWQVDNDIKILKIKASKFEKEKEIKNLARARKMNQFHINKVVSYQ